MLPPSASMLPPSNLVSALVPDSSQSSDSSTFHSSSTSASFSVSHSSSVNMACL